MLSMIPIYILSCFIGNWWCIYQHIISNGDPVEFVHAKSPEIGYLQLKECFWKML